MSEIIMRKLRNLQPLTDKEMEDATLDVLTLLATDRITIKEFLRRVAVIGSLVDLEEKE